MGTSIRVTDTCLNGVHSYSSPVLAPAGTSFTAFGLFMGIAMSITAFPVLARILEDRGLTKTPLGATAITCAAVDDVTAWCLLALVVAIAQAGAVGAAGWTLLLRRMTYDRLCGSIQNMVPVKPVWPKLSPRGKRSPRGEE